MKVITDIQEIDSDKEIVLSIGNFDGVHSGHKIIIDKVVHDAKKSNSLSLIITFKTHPVKIVDAVADPYLITSTTHKLRLIAQRGVDICLLVDFDANFSKLTAESFIEDYLLKHIRIKKIITGFNFRFGSGKAGDNLFLQQYSKKCGFAIEIVEKVFLDKRVPSSTLIRESIKAGKFNLVDELLGRKYSLLGKVIKGAGVGATIGFPTANIDPFHEIVPDQGVYAAFVHVQNKIYESVLNIGTAPVFIPERNEHEVKIEAYLFDFKGDIYGQEIEVFFIKKIRDEMEFQNKDDLAVQIKKDLKASDSIFNESRFSF